MSTFGGYQSYNYSVEDYEYRIEHSIHVHIGSLHLFYQGKIIKIYAEHYKTIHQLIKQQRV